jgi:two-component system chemotaxis response regulator CheB
LYKLSKYRAVIIGCSSGGEDALTQLVRELPKNFSLPIIIIQHLGDDSDDYLAKSLQKKTTLNTCQAFSNLPIVSGTIYTAPANYHLLVGDDNTFNLSLEAPVNFSRPSIDVSFTSAAEVYSNELIGIILSGANSDGCSGLKKIKHQGGLTIVQDPKTTKYTVMPKMAINKVKPAKVMSPKEIGIYLTKINQQIRTNDGESS